MIREVLGIRLLPPLILLHFALRVVSRTGSTQNPSVGEESLLIMACGGMNETRYDGSRDSVLYSIRRKHESQLELRNGKVQPTILVKKLRRFLGGFSYSSTGHRSSVDL